MKKIIAVLIITIICCFSFCGCNDKAITKSEVSNKSKITMYDYCPSLNDFIELLKSNGRKVLGYEEEQGIASWYTNDKLSEYTLVECTKDNLVYCIQIDENYSDLLSYLRLLPGSICSKEKLENEFSTAVETTNKIVSGEVVYTDKSRFSKNGITYSKIVKRTSEKTLSQITSAECEDIIIDPYEYRDLCPNLPKAKLYSIAETKQNNNSFDEAIFYYTCAKSYKDSENKIKECAYQLSSKYYRDKNLVDAGKYAKIANGYKDADSILKEITATLYDDAVSQLNDYSDTGNTEMLKKAYEKFEAFDEAYKETKRFLNIAELCKSGYPGNDLLNDDLVKKIVQKHMLIDFLHNNPNWCRVEKTRYSDGEYEITASLEYVNNMGDEYICIMISTTYPEEELYTDCDKIDNYSVPEKISDYSINDGIFTYNNSQKFRVEIMSDKEICLHSFLTGKKYTLKQRDSKEVQALLSDVNAW